MDQVKDEKLMCSELQLTMEFERMVEKLVRRELLPNRNSLKGLRAINERLSSYLSVSHYHDF